jgi:hypothetical protein
MKTPEVSKAEFLNAIRDGVNDAMTTMITGVTDMPSTDFWNAMEKSMRQAFYDAFTAGEINTTVLVENAIRRVMRELEQEKTPPWSRK